MSEKARSFFKDVLLVGGMFAALSGAYIGFAYAERYRALTGAHIVQSEQLLGFSLALEKSILQQQAKLVEK